MKKLFFVFLALSFFCFLNSCVTLHDKKLSHEEMSSVEVIGSVSASFMTFQPGHIVLKKNVSEKAYSRLLAEARKKYQGNIAIVNITADGSFNLLTALIPLPPVILGMFSNIQTVRATGDVVMYTSLLSTSSYHEKMADAVKNASAAISNNIPGGSTIAILNVFSNDRNLSELAMGELEYNLVNSGKFVIVDRRRLDQVRSEQNFQLSGDVSDASAVSIGNMLGANMVITGEISEAGSARRLTLRALDVKTAQIISMAREQL